MKPLKSASIFSPQAVFLAILAALLMIFLFSNTDTILTKLGMETKTRLKGDLVKAQGELERTVQINADNARSLELERRQTQLLKNELKLLQESKEKAQEQVQKISAKKIDKSKAITAQVVRKSVETSDTVTLPKAEIDALSELNIEQVHGAFEALFAANP